MALSSTILLSVRRTLDIRNSVFIGLAVRQIAEYNIRSPMVQWQQTRNMSRVKRRHTTPPFWHAKTTRTMYPEHVTAENEEFLQAVVDDRFNDEVASSSPLVQAPWQRGEWNSKSQRCGLIGKKIGIYPMWERNGTRVLATLIHISDNHVISHLPGTQLRKEDWKDESRVSKKLRGALVVGADSADPRLFTREYCNMFEKVGLMPKRKLSKFLISDNAVLQPGTPLYATHFRPGDHVDIRGITIDRGFQGVMVRWGFKGMPATHGVTKSHRRGGNIGSGGEMARVFPGTKMPGHMGREHRVMRGCKILRVNSQYNCIWVQGPSVPGATGAYVNVYDSGLLHNRFRDPENHPFFPTHYPADQPLDQLDLYAEDIQPFSEGTITFDEENKK